MNILLILLVLVAIGIGPFLLMVLIGAAGHIFNQPALFISFWQAVIIYLLLWLLGSFFRGGS